MSEGVYFFSLDRIHPNLRHVYSLDSLESLAAKIRSERQMDPIRVWLDGDHLRILDGEKRWRACKKLGMSRVKAVLVKAG